MNRILFVISYLDKGGAERALSNITMNMPDDWECDILINNDKVIDYPYKANIISLNIEEQPHTSSLFFQLRVLLKRIRMLSALKKTGKYIACVSFLDSANVANILSGKKFCKTLISCRSSMANQTSWQYKYIVNPLIRIFYNRADKVIAVSRGIADELEKKFGIAKDRVGVVENGYELEKIRRMSEESISAAEAEWFSVRKVFITVGRLTEQKGQWHLIRAFYDVQKTRKNVGLLILGEGPLEKTLRNLVETLEIQDKVYFTGYTNNPYKYVSRADVFVMPSLNEGFPNALAEAMCLGKSCIATDFPTGARELLCPDRIYDSDRIQKLTFEEYGLITPLCSGRPLSDEPLETEEMELAAAMKKLIDDDAMQRHYAAKSMERRKTLDIYTTVSRWINYMEE